MSHADLSLANLITATTLN